MGLLLQINLFPERISNLQKKLALLSTVTSEHNLINVSTLTTKITI